MSRRKLLSVVAMAAGFVGLASGATSVLAKEIVLGLMCDRTGPTQTVGPFLCPGYHDYVNLVNSKGGVEGFKLRVMEIDHEYKVPPAVEAYERFKKDGAVIVGLYGTPQTAALTSKMIEDKMPGTSPGFGTAAAANGKKYPYIFPVAASYWSQGAAAVKFAQDKLGGSLKGKKIGYIYYDNPAGKEPIEVVQDLSKKLGFKLRLFAVPAPGVEMAAQVLDITARFRPDFVIAHLFGRAPSVFMKEMKGKGFPLSKTVGLVWASAESDIRAAGGFGAVQGYNTMQFAGVGTDFPVIKAINAMYKAEGKPKPKAQAISVYYNRGVLTAAVHVEAIRQAIIANGGKAPTSAQVKEGMEKIKNFTLGGLLPPMEITPADHEGGGWVQIWTIKGNGFKPATKWFKAYRDVILKHLNE